MRYSRGRIIVAAAAVGAVFVLSACGGADEQSAEQPSEQTSPSAAGPGSEEGTGTTPGEPDLAGIPDVVAEVNGQEIDREEFVAAYESQFQQAAAQAQMSGEELDEDALKAQTAETLVDTLLLRQQAEERDLSVSDGEVEDALTELADANQLASVDELLAALEGQGTSPAEVRDQVRTQVLIEQLVIDEAGPIEPTEAELRRLYRQARDQQEQSGQGGATEGFPPFPDVRQQVEQQAVQQEQVRVVGELLQTLRAEADITVNL